MEVLSKSKKQIIFKNLDQDMVNSIQEFVRLNPTNETFDYLQYLESKVVQELNDSQSLCMCLTGQYFVIDTKYIADIINEQFIKKLNKKFDAFKAINFSLEKLYGTPYFNNNKIVFDKYEVVQYGLNYWDDGKNGSSLYELNGEKLKSLVFNLNIDGNIELFGNEKDFSYIENLFNNIKSKQDETFIDTILNDITKYIPDIVYEKYGDKYFSKDFAYEISFDENINNEKPSTECDCIFKLVKNLKFKKPKTTITVNKNHIISRVLELMSRSKYINLSNVKLQTYSKSENKNDIIVRNNPKINDKDFSDVFKIPKKEIDEEILLAIKNISESIDIPYNDNIVKEYLEEYLFDEDLPSFSFDKGCEQEDHSGYIALIKLPYDVNYQFQVEEGDAVEITWSHSIYRTNITNLELIN